MLAVCNAATMPVTAAAGRSGVCGASVPVFGGVLLDLSDVQGIVAVDDASLTVDVLAGTFGHRLEAELRTDHGLTLGHWPQSVELSTVGGWLACRSAGQYSTRYGKIEDLVTGLDVVLADGRRITTGGPPRQAAGPDLTQIFVGSEGTLGVITGARLRAPGPCRPPKDAPPTASRRSPPAWMPAGGSSAGAPPRRSCVCTTRPNRPAAMAPTASTCCSCSTKRRRRWSTPRWRSWRPNAQRPSASTTHWWAAGSGTATTSAPSSRSSRRASWWTRWRSPRPGRGSTRIYDRTVAALRAVPHTLAATAHLSHSYPDGACLYFTFAARPAR